MDERVLWDLNGKETGSLDHLGRELRLSLVGVGLEDLVLDKGTHDERQRAEGHAAVEDVVQSIDKGLKNNPLLGGLEGWETSLGVLPHHVDSGIVREVALQSLSQLVVENGSDNGDSKHLSQTTDKLHRGCDSGHVLGLDCSLDCKGRRLHGETHTETANEEDKDGDHTRGVDREEDAESRAGNEKQIADSREEMEGTLLENPDSRRDRGDDDSNDKGHSLETSNGRRLALDALEIDRQVEEDSKEGHAAEEKGAVGRPEVADLEEMDGENGLLGKLPLDNDEDGRNSETGAEQSNDNTVVPGVLLTAPGQGEEDKDDSGEQESGSDEINALDLVLERTLRGGEVEVEEDEDDRHSTER